MTYIPKGTKRHWTAEEESLLAESWGVCGIPALAKKLNRSQQAIKIRASRLHLGPLLMGGDYVTLNQLVTAFNRTGSYSYKMISWVENRGLPVHNKRVQHFPLFWWSNDDKRAFERTYDIRHSDAYTVYGCSRTGCAGCPFGSRFESELEMLNTFEPSLGVAVSHIFSPSYEYTRAFRDFKKEATRWNL